jgi:hypothetical protein
LEKAGQLEAIGLPARQAIDKGGLTIDVSLPRQGVALFTIEH